METNPNLFNGFDSTRGPKKNVKPGNYTQLSNKDTHEEVIRCLENMQDVDTSDIQVVVENGIVTLKGMIERVELKSDIENALLALDGVDHVHNELREGTAESEGHGEQARTDGSGNPMLRDGSENMHTHGPSDRPTGSHVDEMGDEGDNQTLR